MNQQFQFDINGQKVEATYDTKFLKEVVEPWLTTWTQLAKQKQRRILVFLAAPPAVGKSTLATLLETYAKQMEGIEEVQALGMDGFHHYQDYILNHHVIIDGKQVEMKKVKGCPESFDFTRFKTYLHKIKKEDTMLWPHYNRKRHDVEDDQILVHANVIVIEGNYLLLDEDPWRTLIQDCDDSIFIQTTTDAVKQRLIKRKMMGGSLPHEALSFYENSDKKNVERVLAHPMKATHTLYFDGCTYHIIEER